ncbi:MAG TPA: hypothetical protein VNH13_10210 [Candidatus Acidoferrales bacterium]|jgi:hypothetical protein|nr:hypothetical protein [Candidatus Acidoferrales bacterium]
MGGVGDLTRTIGDAVSGLIGGAVGAIGDAFWTIVHQLQVLLPGPLFYVVVGGGFLALVFWTIRK